MKLKHLSLVTFRNYLTLEVDFDPGVNLLIGSNAQGKTNLLEACHLLATGRSHRTSRDQEMILWQEEGYHIKGLVQKKATNDLLELHVNRQGKKIVRINGILQPKMASLLGQLNVVFFAPEHLELVKGDPSIRRRFLDIAISQISPSYLHHLGQYFLVLHQKNAFLKQERPEATLLDIYNQQLSEHGSSIIQKRKQILQQLEKHAAVHQSILHSTELLRFSYQGAVDNNIEHSKLANQLYQQMCEKTKEELLRRTSLIGPHRDDFIVYLNEKTLRQYGSQGQQRSVVLSLKLAEAQLMETTTGEKPIIILDDVLSELDAERQHHLIQALKSMGQTFISSTAMPPVLSGLHGKVIRIQEGRIQTKEN